MHSAWPGDYHSLGLTRIQFHSPNVTPFTNLATFVDQRLLYCNSNAWGWHNSYQSIVISITDQPIFQNVKKLQSVQEEQMVITDDDNQMVIPIKGGTEINLQPLID